LGNLWLVAGALHNLGRVAYRQGEYAAARALHEESLALGRQHGDRQGIALSLNNLGMVARKEGDHEAASSFYRESLALRREVGDRLGMLNSLEAFAELACEAAIYPVAGEETGLGAELPVLKTDAAASASRRAARLLGAAEALREAIGAPPPRREDEEYRRAVSWAREVLEAGAFAAAWAEGQAMTFEDAVAYALSGPAQ
jgi:tetratricopeptide (TPR) repeat protein